MNLFNKNAAETALKNSLGFPKFLIVRIAIVLMGFAIGLVIGVAISAILIKICVSPETAIQIGAFAWIFSALTMGVFLMDYCEQMEWI